MLAGLPLAWLGSSAMTTQVGADGTAAKLSRPCVCVCYVEELIGPRKSANPCGLITSLVFRRLYIGMLCVHSLYLPAGGSPLGSPPLGARGASQFTPPRPSLRPPPSFFFCYSLPESRAQKGGLPRRTRRRRGRRRRRGQGREGTENTRRENRQAARLGSTNENQAAEQTKRSQKREPG